MAEPKKKLTKTRSGNRRSHQRLSRIGSTQCGHCKAQIVAHRVCPFCGYYKGKKFIKV